MHNSRIIPQIVLKKKKLIKTVKRACDTTQKKKNGSFFRCKVSLEVLIQHKVGALSTNLCYHGNHKRKLWLFHWRDGVLISLAQDQ
jgi:hypothetical protein